MGGGSEGEGHIFHRGRLPPGPRRTAPVCDTKKDSFQSGIFVGFCFWGCGITAGVLTSPLALIVQPQYVFRRQVFTLVGGLHKSLFSTYVRYDLTSPNTTLCLKRLTFVQGWRLYIFKVFIEYPLNLNLGSGCISMFSVKLTFDKTLPMQFCYFFLQKSPPFGL